MPHHDRLRDIENPLRYEGPALADSEAGGNMGPARCVSRSYHAWLWLVVGLVAMGFGIAVGHGLLIAAGLVAAGVAGQLFDPERRGRGRSGSGNRYAP
ncbi:MAG TPA: DUF3040 domain-containing protein [Streptomyces sp.]|jgi:Protein of unknown function (DUF3040).